MSIFRSDGVSGDPPLIETRYAQNRLATGPLTLTSGQRIGLSIVGMFYGEIAAAILLCLAIVGRNLNDLTFVRAHLPALAAVLLQSCALEGAVSVFTWLICAVPLVVLFQPEWFRAQRGRTFLAAAALGTVNIGVYMAVQWQQMHKAGFHARFYTAALIVTWSYGFVLGAVGIWRYLMLARKAELLQAARSRIR